MFRGSERGEKLWEVLSNFYLTWPLCNPAPPSFNTSHWPGCFEKSYIRFGDNNLNLITKGAYYFEEKYGYENQMSKNWKGFLTKKWGIYM